jgi:hypothetical protein
MTTRLSVFYLHWPILSLHQYEAVLRDLMYTYQQTRQYKSARRVPCHRLMPRLLTGTIQARFAAVDHWVRSAKGTGLSMTGDHQH